MARKSNRAAEVETVPRGLKLLHVLRGHEDVILRLFWTQSGGTLVSTSVDKTIRLWDPDRGVLRVCLDGHFEGVNQVVCPTDERWLASCSFDRTIRLWDLQAKKTLSVLQGHSDDISSIDLSPDDKVLASGSADHTIRLWSTRTWESFKTLDEHRAGVYRVAWSPDGKCLASCSKDGRAVVWDTSTWNKIYTLSLPFRERPSSVAWSHNGGRTLAVTTFNGRTHLWTRGQSAPEVILEGHTSIVRSAAFSPDDRILATSSMDGTIRLWRLDTWKEITRFIEPTSGFWPQGIAFHPVEPILATFGDKDETIRLWQLDCSVLLAPELLKASTYYTNAKVVLVGESSTGKSCLARALMGERFQAQKSTHGMQVWDFDSQVIERDDGSRVSRETTLWDLAGQVDYQVVHQLFLDQTALGIVTFDASDAQDPLRGVDYWERALLRATGRKCPRLLAAGRVDRGHPTMTHADMETFRKAHGYTHFLETSAATGQGIDELREAIRQSIPWEQLPVMSSPELWNQIRQYLLDRRSGAEVLTRRADLRSAFRATHPEAEFNDACFDAVMGHAQAQGLLWQLSFGDFVLLKPELLNNYAAAVVRVARGHADGLGCVRDQDVLNGAINFEDLERLPDAQAERVLLHAVVQLFLERELALRDSEYLIFPSKFNRQRPDIPQPKRRDVVYRFAGSVEEIYATLIVRLSYCGSFTRRELWKNAAEFTDMLGNTCGITLDGSAGGQGVLSTFFDERTSDATKALFLHFMYEHLKAHAIGGSVVRERVYRCPNCTEEVRDPRVIQTRLERRLTTMRCQYCDGTIALTDTLNTMLADPSLPQQVHALESGTATRQKEVRDTIIVDAKKWVEEYDVFLAHNNVDKPQVEAISRHLMKRGLNPWLDKDQIPPGRWFQDVIQRAIQNVKSAAVFIGPSGLGRWETLEFRASISQCVERGIPVIPVLLPGVDGFPPDVVFLRELNWVKFAHSVDEPNALDNLQWGITGEHPKLQGE
jgi:small GTP-binding protein